MPQLTLLRLACDKHRSSTAVVAISMHSLCVRKRDVTVRSENAWRQLGNVRILALRHLETLLEHHV